jgi:Glycosyl transferase family 2
MFRRRHLEQRLADLEASAAGAREHLAGHQEWLRDLERWVRSCVTGLAALGAQPLPGESPALSGAPDLTGRLISALEVWTVMSWIKDAADVEEGPLVSVQIATRNRPEYLRRAVRSVLDQSYRRIDLLVVDDSDGDETQRALAEVDDPRLRTVRTDAHNGGAAAVNVGLPLLQGELVAFLDDDNLMHPEWIRSVVWAFGRQPELEALYGARIVEDPGADGAPSGDLPLLEFLGYDRRRHERANFVDRNTLAFRARHCDILYDEHLDSAWDWDHSLRLFARATPLALPAVACYYGTLAPDRVSLTATRMEMVRIVRSRAHRSRPLRVHLCGEPNGVDELEAAGAVVTRSPELEAPLPEPLPDLVLLDAASPADEELLSELDVPYFTRDALPADGELHAALRQRLTDWLAARA